MNRGRKSARRMLSVDSSAESMDMTDNQEQLARSESRSNRHVILPIIFKA